ncbi:hypothetical protein BDU57DRAFT_84887 [Ampelomyces quisqualis]|uniref:Glycoside hydrolase/deacetylase n=1 Tax=Ampelomyces quisqualis TaxID=50730 RepID=A0A6A5Q8N7_AMPQU|nr:hypothetical protein BDU57DRAFT_84887 [Ampelomyces quisqualis]
MHFSNAFTALLVASLVAAHENQIPGAPKMFGVPKSLRARSLFAGHQNVAHIPVSRLHARQGGNAEGRCGPQGGGASCASGYCCSTQGWCGNTNDYCAAPDCQINYGPGCDANKTPYGATTAQDSRSQLGSIQYGGVGIRECLKPKTVAITYDDGPYIYTEQVMDLFKAYNAKATFFVTGNNLGKGSIDENWTGVISKMYAEGHQIASHTWSHQNLDQITHDQRVDQMVKNEMAIRNIIGRYPTYMRPPYSACITRPCMDDMKTLGYVITSFDLDTDDYNQLTKEKIQTAKNNFKNSLDSAGADGGRLAIAHDIHELTALNLTGYMLEQVYSKGWTAVTVGQCMQDPAANWYRDSGPGVRPSATPSSSVPVPTPTRPMSKDGSCGSASGQSCIGFVDPEGLSECCSVAGYCSNKDMWYGTGCNTSFGKCGPQTSVSASVTPSVSSSSSASHPTVYLGTSTAGDCGATVGKTCKGFLPEDRKVECCSEYYYCGNADAHCGTTCNHLYGNCETSGSSSRAFESRSLSAAQSSSTLASVSQTVSRTPSAPASHSSAASASKYESSTTVSKPASPTPVSKHRSSTLISKPASSTPASKFASIYVSIPSSTPAFKHESSTAMSKSEIYSINFSKPASISVYIPSSTPVSKGDVYFTPASNDNVHSPPSAVYSGFFSTQVYPSSTMSTVVRPSSTPCDDDKAIPTPTPSVVASK